MKNIFFKAALFLVMPLLTATFVSCDDEDDVPTPPPFQSELIGTYNPTFINYQLPGANDPMDYYFIVDYKWKEGVDPSSLLIGGFLPMPQALGIMQGLVSEIVKGGFNELDLKNDGSFTAKYKDLILPENADMSAIMGALLAPQFGEEIKQFPSPETAAVLPDNALGYYTENGKFFLTVSKAFLKETGNKIDTDLVGMIDGANTSFKLGFVSTDEYIAIPLKYTLENGLLTLYVDRGMMEPFLPLLKPILANVPPVMGMINLLETMNMLFDNVEDIQFKLLLQKK